ncbi:MAG TPA: site-2 protease family protein [Alphaproteobacteria bacterium]|nr:site-2 protease family protein [Alphaproteobacteria bacterium]
MQGRRWTLLRLFGFEIRFELTWLILLALVVWTLSAGYFPEAYGNLASGTYFWMGVLGAIGLVASIVIHELSHSLVARAHGMTIRGITLFAFGGAAELEDEPPTARAEFLMAAAGPLTSLVLAIGFYLLSAALQAAAVPMPFVGVIQYLAFINVVLAVFNLVPAFPLDGGRMLRAVLWGWRGDMRWATRIAASLGGAFGLGLILLGIYNAVTGNIVGGMWYALIGLFVRAAAAGSYQRLVTRQILGRMPIARVMTREPVTVSPDATVAELVELYFLGRNLKLVPVVADAVVRGIVDVRAAKAVPRPEWELRRVVEILTPLSPENTIALGADASAALEQMQRTGQSRLLVMDGHRLAGIVSLKDMLRIVSLRLDLDDTGEAPSGGRVQARYRLGAGREG